MVEIACPACGAAGRAPKDKILTRLVCRKCLKVFHVMPSGKTVLGEPPATGQKAAAVSQRTVAADRTQDVDQWLDRVSKRFSSPTSLILAVGLILLAVAAAYFTSRGQESLQDRVAQAARAAVQGDLRTIRDMAVTGTRDEVDAWYISIRPQCDELLVRLSSRKLAVETVVKQVDSTQEQIEVVAQVSIEEGLERRGNLLPDASSVVTPIISPLSLPMAWKSEGRSGWRLDGKRTQEISKSVR
jgi:HAMP domain-containing protein